MDPMQIVLLKLSKILNLKVGGQDRAEMKVGGSRPMRPLPGSANYASERNFTMEDEDRY